MQRIHNYRRAGLFVSNYKSFPSPAFFCVKKKKQYIWNTEILHQKFSSAAKEELNELISTNSISPKLRHPVYRKPLPLLYLPRVRESDFILQQVSEPRGWTTSRVVPPGVFLSPWATEPTYTLCRLGAHPLMAGSSADEFHPKLLQVINCGFNFEAGSVAGANSRGQRLWTSSEDNAVLRSVSETAGLSWE